MRIQKNQLNYLLTQLIKPLKFQQKLLRILKIISRQNKFKKINKAKEISNEKVSELMNDKGMIVPYLTFSLVNLFKPENESQYRLIKNLILTKKIVCFDKYKCTNYSI